MRLSASQFREFGERGYVVVPGVIPSTAIETTTAAIDGLMAADPPAPDYVGQHFYWIAGLHDPSVPVDTAIATERKGNHDARASFMGVAPAAMTARDAALALYHDTPLEALATSLVAPGELEIAFDQAQFALTTPQFSHRPGRGHVDGCEYMPDGTPGTFTFLIGVIMSDQTVENTGNLWVWPGTHRMHAEYCRARGPEALIMSGCYPDIEITEPTQILGKPGDVVFAHYMLSHNTGGNFTGERLRKTVYYRMRRVGHSSRWRECVQDELLEFDPVRAVIQNDTAEPANHATTNAASPRAESSRHE
jgi:hypothetical protein